MQYGHRKSFPPKSDVSIKKKIWFKKEVVMWSSHTSIGALVGENNEKWWQRRKRSFFLAPRSTKNLLTPQTLSPPVHSSHGQMLFLTLWPLSPRRHHGPQQYAGGGNGWKTSVIPPWLGFFPPTRLIYEPELELSHGVDQKVRPKTKKTTTKNWTLPPCCSPTTFCSARPHQGGGWARVYPWEMWYALDWSPANQICCGGPQMDMIQNVIATQNPSRGVSF